MKLRHPLYGYMNVPDSVEEQRQQVLSVKMLLEQGYHPMIQAYRDMIELALDLERRKS